jgi:uncharacterized lipoprotein YmbA
MRATLARAVVWALVVLTASCSTSSSHLYTLSSAAAAGAAPAAANITVVVGPVSIPAIVDTPQIVLSTGPNQVRQDEFNRWAAPLPNDITRVVVANLVTLLGTPRVAGLLDSVRGTADYHVAIAVQAFESAPGEAATLNAVWSVRRTKDDKSDTGRTTVREPVTEKGYQALAAAHSRALARLSQDIADAIRTMDRAAP